MKKIFTLSGWTSREDSTKGKWNNGIEADAKKTFLAGGKYLSKRYCLMISFLLLAVGMLGIFAGFMTAFSVSCNKIVLYLMVVLFSFADCLLFGMEKLKKHRKYYAGILAGIYAVVVIMNMEYIIQGIRDCKNMVLYSANIRYHSEMQAGKAVLSGSEMTVFLMLVMAGIIFIVSFFAIVKADILPVLMIELPILAVIVVLGREISQSAFIWIGIHIFGMLAENTMQHQKEYLAQGKNDNYFYSIQKKAAVWAGAGILSAACITSFFLMPVLSEKPEFMQRLGAKVEGRAVEFLVEFMPVLTGGKEEFKVKTAGGGVTDGKLGEEYGYALANLNDLSVTSTIKPQETIYLKGYVGSRYEENEWKKPNEKIFQNASRHWYTQDNASLYIQNLPFLRNLYREEAQGNAVSDMGILTVKRLNASEKYTFVPYCAYLNDYYQVQGGDGFAAGQTKAEDKFSYYPMKKYIEVMENAGEGEKDSILDHSEASYNAYVRQNYLQIPKGFEALKKQCGEQNLKEEDTEEIIKYVTAFLVSNYRYNIQVQKLPKDKDFIQYFLYESKEGYSAHFASAAVLMFRCFKIPARYVTGYAAPESIFAPDKDGNYAALLQSDNSHAWAEIYLSGKGWIPVETTPGTMGVLQNILDIEETEKQEDSKEEMEDSALQEETPEESDGGEEEEEMLLGEKKKHIFLSVLILGICAVCSMAVRKRIVYERKKRGYDRKESTNERVVSIFCCMYEKMQKAGMPQNITSASEEFRVWLERILPSLPEKERETLLRLVLESSYSSRNITEAEVEWMRKIYKKSLIGIKNYKKLSKKK